TGTGAVSGAGGAELARAGAVAVASPPGGGETTVLSAPVKLSVGRLYRLSAGVETRGVTVDQAPRYPSALGACVAMKSFPFTNCSAPLAGDSSRRVEILFFATTASDRVALHLGRNGKATGSATFSDVRLEEVEDVTAYVPLAQVKWAGPGFRYDDGGWIFVHVEGEPYPRGRQYGELVAPELARYLEKLATLQDRGDPEKGWNGMRRLADALMLRRYDTEYLEEMKGIADGAAKAGAKFKGRPVDLLDVVTLNSAVDLSQLDEALHVSPTAITGKSFLSAEDETDPAVTAKDRCSSFVATRSATPDGRFVMGQIFMWNGYSGIHWDVILDVVPTRGRRVVLQTFPGGIHSGSDWYLNDAGIVIGETTVGQTPFAPEGTPQSNRARKAAQYGTSIDEVSRILRERNNGLYTNDWTIADAKTDEGADLLLGTNAWKLWRTGSPGHAADTPGNLRDFVWANNNTRDPAVRREYARTTDGVPADMAFNAWNRDIAFWKFYEQYGKGKIDLEAAVRLFASSPVNRPHACDGKITTGEMADRLVFVAHYGKTTLREKWVGSRFVPDLPHATPHFTLGYTTFSPVVMADGLRAARARAGTPPAAPADPKVDASALKEAVTFDRKLLWEGTIHPAGDADNWLTSGAAAYWSILKKLPEDPPKGLASLREALSDADLRLAWLSAREPVLAPSATRSAYDGYASYGVPRIRGTFALHQLRLAVGNATFSRILQAAVDRSATRPITTAQFTALASEIAGRDVGPVLVPWIETADLPDPVITARAAKTAEGYTLTVQAAHRRPWRYAAAVAITGEKGVRYEHVQVDGAEGNFTFSLKERPVRVAYDAVGDVPVPRDGGVSLPSMLDDFSALLWVRGSSREVEANRTLAGLWRDVVADTFVEVLPPLATDVEIPDADLAAHDLVVVGGPEDNAVAARMAERWKLPLETGKGHFRWQGKTYSRPDDGIMVAFPNPWNPKRTAFLYVANSKVQAWRMLRAWQRGLPSWAVWKEGEVAEKGYLGAERLDVAVKVEGA
ncbi:MAG: C45 family autoproteolytic acyltransferase/hydrolase, partial [Anaeromyxobacteraceae bacterium]